MSTLSLGLILCSLMLMTSQTSALKCWRCASDSSNSEFCQEKLDLTLLTPQQRNWNFVECSPPKEPRNVYGEKMVSKCRMQIQSIGGQKIYSRHCVAEAENAERNACLVRSVLPQVKILACETCQEDGCNEFLSEKPGELKAVDGNSAGIKINIFDTIIFDGFWFCMLVVLIMCLKSRKSVKPK